ncbi:MAG: hypothetical protein WDZ27_00115 [Waddliaceae bacterium]
MVSMECSEVDFRDVLTHFMHELDDEEEVKLNEVNCQFLDTRRAQVEKSGSIARRYFNRLVEYVNRQAGKMIAKRIVHPSIQAIRDSIGIKTKDVQNLVMDALGTIEFEKNDNDIAIEIAREINASHVTFFGEITVQHMKEISEIPSVRSISCIGFPVSTLLRINGHKQARLDILKYLK